MTEFDDLVARLEADPYVLGIVLTGSAARDMATEYSDHDVIVVVPEYNDAYPRITRYSPEIDEIIYSLAELGGPHERWNRWAFRGAKIVLDRTGGEIQPLLDASGLPTPEEAVAEARASFDVLINQAYRAAKSRREGRHVQARLDEMECVAPILGTLFGLYGRFRPYNKYLRWELEHYPLGIPWDAETFPERLVADPIAIWLDLEPLAREHGLGDLLDEWESRELDIIRQVAGKSVGARP